MSAASDHDGATDLAVQVAQACARVSENISLEVTERAAHLVLDSLGCGLAAQSQGLGDAVLASLQAWSTGGEHVVVGSSARLSARDAAFANGMLMHSLEFDDVHMASVMHLTCAVLPAALATGVHAGRSGEEVLLAYIAAVEIGARLGMADGGGFQARGFHPTSVVGVFAATCASAMLLGASTSAIQRAQGIALSFASGAMQFLEGGGTTKRLHPGWAAQSGMTAAMMGMHGVEAPTGAYEGSFGLYRSFLGRDVDAQALGDALSTVGQRWETLDIAIKPYPAAYYSHACVEAAIELAHYDNLHTYDIEEVIAHVPNQVMSKIAEPLAAKQSPTSASAAQFSLPYLVACALLRRRLTLPDLAPAGLACPEVLAMAARVRGQGDSDTDFPRVYPGKLSIRLKNGHVLTKSIPINLGAAARPVANGFIVDKFVCSLGDESARGLAHQLLGLGAVTDMAAYTRLLAQCERQL